MINLWPDDIIVNKNDTFPVTILREQAAFLGQQTRNLVEAAVVTVESRWDKPNHFVYAFQIIAPPLNHYRYELFTISYGVDSYPVQFRLDTQVAEEVIGEGITMQVENEAEFMSALRSIFNSRRTRHIIQVLLSQMG